MSAEDVHKKYKVFYDYFDKLAESMGINIE